MKGLFAGKTDHSAQDVPSASTTTAKGMILELCAGSAML